MKGEEAAGTPWKVLMGKGIENAGGFGIEKNGSALSGV